MKPLNELPLNKICTKCGKSYPRDCVHFHTYSGRSIDGLRPICKPCRRIADAEWQRNNRQKKKTAQ